ncbi:MAG: pyridoxal phosphate-dependent aminotransferase [Planctomycetota bacterium]
MPLSLSKKSECVMQSEIRNMSIECDKVGGINLSQGICNLDVPLPVRRGAMAAMDAGLNTYTRYDGIDELRTAVAHKLKRRYGIDADPDREVIVTSGSTGAFYCAALALLDPGDEVILFEPYYGYHLSTLQATGAEARYVTLRPPDWAFTAADMEAACTSKTKGIMVCTPSNPSGKIFTRQELELIGDFAKSHDLFIFTDEIYEHFVYDGAEHIPPATLRDIGDRVITISGMSKTFSITGWRVGYCHAHSRWAQTIGYFHDLVYVCAPAPLQVGVADGLRTLDDDYYRDLLGLFVKKREMICSTLAEVGFSPSIPQGGYYVLADISSLPGDGSKARAMHLLEKTGVACVPGEAFYHDPRNGQDLARFCFAKSDEELSDACGRLRVFAGK